jgi:hypothetical protein
LLQKSASEDLERFAIAQMKVACGPQYTKKMEDMLADFVMCREAAAVRWFSGWFHVIGFVIITHRRYLLGMMLSDILPASKINRRCGDSRV